jgi:hypothetical protein
MNVIYGCKNFNNTLFIVEKTHMKNISSRLNNLNKFVNDLAKEQAIDFNLTYVTEH